MDAVVRMPMSAPPPSMRTLVSSESVQRAAGNPPMVNGSPIASGRFHGIQRAFTSLRSATTTPTPPAPTSQRALRIPSPLRACSARMVSAVAVPVGKGSASTFTSCRFTGMARKTPRDATAANQRKSQPPGGAAPVRRSSAPSAARLPPPVM